MHDRGDGDASVDRHVLALVADLMFASKVGGAARQAGVSAKTVHRESELYAGIRERRPRLILVDLDLRGADVAAIIRRLKNEPETGEIPVVGFVSHVNRTAIEAAREAGADQVLARSAFVRRLPALLAGTDEDGP